MKFNKLFSIFALVAFLFSNLILPAYASIDVEKDGTKKRVERIVIQDNLNVTFPSNDVAEIDGTIPTLTDSRGDDAVLVLASSSTVITDSSLPYSTIVKYVGGGGGLDSTGIGTSFPNAPVDGQCISIIIAGLQSGGSWKVTPVLSTGFTAITFDTKGDTATMCYANDTIGWYIDSNGGAVLTQA